jgi:two-component system chemotaxis sensor kinase CheA
MSSERDEKLLRRLLVTFKGEAQERIGALSQGLASLATRGGAPDEALLEAMFRDAHSLKAAARSVGQKEIEILCQSLESAFAAVKRGRIGVPPSLLPALRAAGEAMEDNLAALDAPSSPERQARAAALAKALEAGLQQAVSSASAVPTEPAPSSEPMANRADEAAVMPPAGTPSGRRTEPVTATETVRLSVQRLDGLLRDSEEMLSEKLAARQIASQLHEAVASLTEWRRDWGKALAALARPADGRKAGSALRPLLDWNERTIAGLEARLAALTKTADAEAHRLGLKVDKLLREVRDILTLPCASLLELFPRMVRELARDQDKQVELRIEGGELEIDRRILQELREPLLHLVRNSLDHGIEKPGDRVAAGKPARATISIRIASKDGDKVEFSVGDDGAGIASGKLAMAAIKLGVLSAEQAAAMEEPELLQLIFESGVSTSPLITDMSGRGLGLAIVRERVERLGGRISIETEIDRGTVFRLLLPLSLATYHGISVRIGNQTLVFPTLAVAQVVGARRSALATVESRLMLDVGGAPVPLVPLRDVLELPAGPPPTSERLEAVIVGAAGRQVAFEVDAVLGDQEILLKPLGKCLLRVRNVQGGTILGNGEIAPVLNVADLVKSAVRVAARSGTGDLPSVPQTTAQRTILVVEDSITARGLLRSILESAGYRVKTAVDGMEAWATLNLEPFDIVVSDIEMPRMNGFDLTARIRSHGKLSELPVVLVTALASPEDRERGADAGANAYIIKGGFDQGALLEAVKRLI